VPCLRGSNRDAVHHGRRGLAGGHRPIRVADPAEARDPTDQQRRDAEGGRGHRRDLPPPRPANRNASVVGGRREASLVLEQVPQVSFEVVHRSSLLTIVRRLSIPRDTSDLAAGTEHGIAAATCSSGRSS
jgi:hypothetical protein